MVYTNPHEIGLYCWHNWRLLRESGPYSLESDEMVRTGQMIAYASVLRQITGRNIGTEEELVREILDNLGDEDAIC